jgi:hypothetical protein
LERGYVLNPYDFCVASKTITRKQFTVVWHVDDLKLSHENEGALDAEVTWLETMYRPLVGAKGSKHTYLGMDLDFGDQQLKPSIVPYLQEILNEFPDNIGKAVLTAESLHLLDMYKVIVLVNARQAKQFHHPVAMKLWRAIDARPDLLLALSFLTCQTKAPDTNTHKKYYECDVTCRRLSMCPLSCHPRDQTLSNGGLMHPTPCALISGVKPVHS